MRLVISSSLLKKKRHHWSRSILIFEDTFRDFSIVVIGYEKATSKIDSAYFFNSRKRKPNQCKIRIGKIKPLRANDIFLMIYNPRRKFIVDCGDLTLDIRNIFSKRNAILENDASI